jgi:hypothetical protein
LTAADAESLGEQKMTSHVGENTARDGSSDLYVHGRVRRGGTEFSMRWRGRSSEIRRSESSEDDESRPYPPAPPDG